MAHYHVIANDTETGERQLSYEVLGDEGQRAYDTREAAQAAADSLTESDYYPSVEYGVTPQCLGNCEAR